jgi:hypothetical protein
LFPKFLFQFFDKRFEDCPVIRFERRSCGLLDRLEQLLARQQERSGFRIAPEGIFGEFLMNAFEDADLSRCAVLSHFDLAAKNLLDDRRLVLRSFWSAALVAGLAGLELVLDGRPAIANIGSFPRRAGAQAMMQGVNAAVVGILGAALDNPVWTTSVRAPRDFGIALVDFVLLMVWRAPPLLVVAVGAIGGITLSRIG